jgi:hypothetical protein
MVVFVTVTTCIALYDPVPVERVWALSGNLLDAPVNYRWIDLADDKAEGVHTRRAAAGQGCRALLWMHWANDGPVGPLCWSSDDRRQPPRVEQVCLTVCVDTPNSYRTGRGGGPGDLHAWFANNLVSALAVTGWVQDEFTGTWYPCEGAAVAAIGDPALGAP